MELKKVNVVGAVIIDKAKGVLCALRGKTMSMSGMWEFPGGKIEPGESPQQALQREIKEELNCMIQVGEQLEDIVYQYPEVEVRLITFKSTVIQGEPVAREHEELRWVQMEQLRDLSWAPADIPTVQSLVGVGPTL